MRRHLEFLLACVVAGALPAYAQVEAQTAMDAARAAALADRNQEAADAFRAAIAQSPQRRRELLQEFADQLLYSGQSREAIPLYEDVLQAPRSDAERRSARKGLALAFLRTDQPARARPLLEELHREQPGDEDVSRNLGRALSWGGHQRKAVAHLRAHVERHPQDGEAHVQLAQAQQWMGRHDLALNALHGVEREDARRMRARLERETAPRTTLDGQRSSQSDGLDIRNWRAGHVVTFSGGLAAAGLRLERDEYEREDGTDAARVDRPILFGRWRFSDAFEWNGTLGRERIAPRATPVHEFTAYNTWLTWWPNDVLRFDASSGRGDFDNLRSLRMGVTHHDTGLSMDVTPSDRHRITVRLQRSELSDGNRRDTAHLESEWRARTRPDLWIGARYIQLEFDRQLSNGYFNPKRFQSLLGTLRVHWRPLGDDSPWEVDARAAWGREHAVPDGDKPTYDASLRAAYRFDSSTRLELRAQRFSSRTSASSGFARTTFGVSLELGW